MDLGSIGAIRAGSIPVVRTIVNESLRYTKESEVFYLHLSERFKRTAGFKRCLEKALPIEKEQLIVACLSEAALLIRQTAKQPGG